MNSATFRIPFDHPCLDGHFPDAPIVPGVVVLDRVIEAVQTANATRVTGIRRCKFVSGLYPDQDCRIEWRPGSNDTARFTCRGPDGPVAQGVLQVVGDPHG